MDRNDVLAISAVLELMSLSARRAWIEMCGGGWGSAPDWVALRKESVDRNTKTVALEDPESVALRKESVDRNGKFRNPSRPGKMSLSARRAWIEISTYVTRLPRAQGRSPQGERG